MSKQKVNCAKGTREADLGHAVLSASGSHRWLNCTPSARLELEFENTTSEAAREGTAAHGYFICWKFDDIYEIYGLPSEQIAIDRDTTCIVVDYYLRNLNSSV